MRQDDVLLARALMENAAEYMQQGLLDEAAEIMAVAEKMEIGTDPFCDLGCVDDEQDRKDEVLQ
jgi:hypothetical protein